MNENNSPALKTKLVNLSVFLTLVASALFILVQIIDLWPNKFGIGTDFFGYKLGIEKRIMLLVILGGGLGSFIHTATSFTDYLGNKTLKFSWIPWYFMRPFIGSALALIVYLLLRGGLFNPTFDNTSSYNNYSFTVIDLDSLQRDFDNYVTILEEDTTHTAFQKDSLLQIKKQQLYIAQKENNEIPPVNPFGIVAIACLAGMFSRQAIDKLQEIFESIFAVQHAVDRKDKIDGSDES